MKRERAPRVQLLSSFEGAFYTQNFYLILASTAQNVSAMIRRRVSDGKVVVRKAAIQVSMHAGFIVIA